MEDGPPMFSQEFHVLRPTCCNLVSMAFVYRAITLYRRTFQTVPLTHDKIAGWSPFARRY